MGRLFWAMGLLWGKETAICISPNELNNYQKQYGSELGRFQHSRLVALFPAGGIAQGDGEVVWAMGLREIAICISPNELNNYLKQHGS